MLKKFYLKLLMLFLLLGSFICAIVWLSAKDSMRIALAKCFGCEDYILVNNGPDEIKPYIDKARADDEYTKLILGDSVCHQMYIGLQEYNDDICILGSNAAISATGQYILLHEFLTNHEDVTDVWLIFIPTAMGVTFDAVYGYQYAVMPFVEKDLLDVLHEDTIKQMENIYGKYALRKEFVNFIDCSAIARKGYLSFIRKTAKVTDLQCVTLASREYIYSMNEMCKNRGVTFHLLPGPICDSEEKREYITEFTDFYSETVLNDLFPNYCECIRFYPEEYFRDGIHFGGEFADQKVYNEIIKEVYSDESLLTYLEGLDE